MLPLAFPEKRAALAGAFVSRFSLGFFAATVQLPVSPVLAGMIVGLLTSVPDAIITKAYVPITVSGIVFGALAGWIVGRWAIMVNGQVAPSSAAAIRELVADRLDGESQLFRGKIAFMRSVVTNDLGL